jgi:hypothetical protein
VGLSSHLLRSKLRVKEGGVGVSSGVAIAVNGSVPPPGLNRCAGIKIRDEMA